MEVKLLGGSNPLRALAPVYGSFFYGINASPTALTTCRRSKVQVSDGRPPSGPRLAGGGAGDYALGMNAAVFLDRDNTLIHNDGDLGDPNEVRLIQGVATAVASLCGLGYKVVVITNQGGVARGKYTEEDVLAVNQRSANYWRPGPTGRRSTGTTSARITRRAPSRVTARNTPTANPPRGCCSKRRGTWAWTCAELDDRGPGARHPGGAGCGYPGDLTAGSMPTG